MIETGGQSVTLNRSICYKKGEKSPECRPRQAADWSRFGGRTGWRFRMGEMSTDLIDRWRDGDEEAARLLFERYSRQLTAVAARHLSKKVGVRVDDQDVVQSVFRTFFRRSAEGQFRIDESLDIWHLLANITLRKAQMQGRRHTAGRRDVGLETAATADDWLPVALASGPSPDDAAILVDQVESLLAGLPGLYAELLGLLLDGHSKTDIAEELGVSRQTVHRAVNLLRERLQQSMRDSSEIN